MGMFSEKTVLITGGSRGVGRHLAVAFSEAGAKVAINYEQNEEGALETVDLAREKGGQVLAMKADVSRSDAVDGLVDKVTETFGSVDVLVNNAGINRDSPLLEMSEADWDRVHAVNLKGPFLLTRKVGRAMVSAGSGRIVNISAVTAVDARANAANYCSSKAGLNMLTKCAAIELGPQVQVNAIALGFIRSELVEEVFSAEQLAGVIGETPVGRLGEIADVCELVMFLASNAASFITGQTIILDGGRIMR